MRLLKAFPCSGLVVILCWSAASSGEPVHSGSIDFTDVKKLHARLRATGSIATVYQIEEAGQPATYVQFAALYAGGQGGLRHIAGLPNLYSLDLSWSNISDEAMLEVGKMESLVELRLSHVKLGEGAIASLKGLGNLKRLMLESTATTDDDLAWIAELTSLEVLQLGGTRITDDGLRHLRKLKNLRILSLNGLSGRITGRGFEYLSDLKELESLDLCGTRIDDDTLKHFTKEPSLKRLNLCTDTLGPKNYWHVTKIKSLEYLEGGTYQDDKTMFDALPNLKLIYSP